MGVCRLCEYCGRKVELGKSCDCKHVKRKQEERKQQHKKYDQTKRSHESYSFYHSSRWAKLTGMCKQRFNNVDMYQWHRNKRLMYGTLSHHIEERELRPDLAYELDNLIWVSPRSHKQIHDAYRKGGKIEKEMKEFLRGVVALGKGEAKKF